MLEQLEHNHLLKTILNQANIGIYVMDTNGEVVYFNKFFLDIKERRGLDIHDVDWFLPHLSSEYFRGRIEEELIRTNIPIPQEKWFTNLQRLGNVGAASIYFMLEELFHSDKLKKGDRILCMVPESARFSYVYALLTAV